MARHLMALAVLAIAQASPGFAQGLADPMRPPRELFAAGSEATQEPGASPAQVVIISTDRSQATINGKAVPLGGRYGDYTLVRITDSELVLRKVDSTEEIIRLYSAVSKKPAREGTRATSTVTGRKDGGYEAN